MNSRHRPILHWLTARLAASLGVTATALDPMVPLAEMGVDSVHAVSLVGEIEAHFDIDVDPTLSLAAAHRIAHESEHEERQKRHRRHGAYNHRPGHVLHFAGTTPPQSHRYGYDKA